MLCNTFCKLWTLSTTSASSNHVNRIRQKSFRCLLNIHFQLYFGVDWLIVFAIIFSISGQRPIFHPVLDLSAQWGSKSGSSVVEGMTHTHKTGYLCRSSAQPAVHFYNTMLKNYKELNIYHDQQSHEKFKLLQWPWLTISL